jgi:hypothetical protein
VDRDRLVFDVDPARARLLAFVTLDSESGARARKELFSEILESAVSFKERLLDDRGHRYAARGIFPIVSDREAFLDALDRVIKAATTLKDENSHGAWVRLERPLKEWFAAEILPEVFERNFGRRAKVSRRFQSKTRANAVGGPYIRFAVAVMREMGILISAATVARALKDVRAGRERRNR